MSRWKKGTWICGSCGKAVTVTEGAEFFDCIECGSGNFRRQQPSPEAEALLKGQIDMSPKLGDAYHGELSIEEKHGLEVGGSDTARLQQIRESLVALGAYAAVHDAQWLLEQYDAQALALRAIREERDEALRSEDAAGDGWGEAVEGNNIVDTCQWRGVICLAMFPFFAGMFAAAISDLRSAAHSLALTTRKTYPEQQAWDEAQDAIGAVALVVKGTPLDKWLEESGKLQRASVWLKQRNPQTMGAFLMELGADFGLEVNRYQALLIPPEKRMDYLSPLSRFGTSIDKFQKAQDEMAAAVRCFVLDEWDASAFHSMRVLEHGLRWLASQFPNLTLKKPVDMENWENIIGNIQARINDELRANTPRTRERDALLAFYSMAAAEFRYFKDAWRNYVMHERNEAYDEGTAGSVLDHVVTFMQILAVHV